MNIIWALLIALVISWTLFVIGVIVKESLSRSRRGSSQERGGASPRGEQGVSIPSGSGEIEYSVVGNTKTVFIKNLEGKVSLRENNGGIEISYQGMSDPTEEATVLAGSLEVDLEDGKSVFDDRVSVTDIDNLLTNPNREDVDQRKALRGLLYTEFLSDFMKLSSGDKRGLLGELEYMIKEQEYLEKEDRSYEDVATEEEINKYINEQSDETKN